MRKRIRLAGMLAFVMVLALTGALRAGEEAAGGETVTLEQVRQDLRFGNNEAFEKLLTANTDLINVPAESGETLLHTAARLANQPAVNFLITNGADVNATDDQGRTPLHYAAQASDPGMVTSLLAADAEVNPLDLQGRSPLDYSGSSEVYDFLAKKGGKSGADIVSELDRWVKSNLPPFLHPIAEYDIFGYPFWRIAASLLILMAAFGINTTIRFFIRRRAEKEDAEEKAREEEEARQKAEDAPGNEPVKPVSHTRAFFSLTLDATLLPLRVIIWACAVRLVGPVLVPEYVSSAIWITETLFAVSIAVFLYQFVGVIEYYLMKYADKTDTKLDDMLIPVVRKALRTVVIVIAGLHLYQSVTNQPITTILAGLGLGGLAFALAAQDTLKNFFGFIMIAVDRPFVVGERINFDGHDGVIEYVGLRSTRMRRLDGHVVTIPNSKAADSVIWNIARRPYIRRIMNIGLTYDTPPDKVERAVEIVKEIFDNHEGMDKEFPPRVYFSEFNADNLNIIAIYWYHPPLYWDYMEHCQKVNLELMRRFEAEGIEFAFPTQTLYLAGDPARQLVVKHEGLPGMEGVPDKS